MLRIYAPSETLIRTDAWDFTLEELSYLLEEHDGESFVLTDNRLWEAEAPYTVNTKGEL